MNTQGQDATQKRYDYLTKTPVEKLVIQLSIPTIFSMLVTSFYNMADTFFVGKISTSATAAVGLNFSVMALIQALGFFCGHGSGNYVSRMLGRKDNKEATIMASTGFAVSLLLGLVVLIVGECFLPSICMLLGARPTSLVDTQNYMRIILLGSPIMMGQLVINNQLRFQGSAVYAMVGLVTGAVFNIIVDPILIFGFHLGVTGAAISTVLGQFVSLAILWIGNHKGANVAIDFCSVKFSLHYILEMINGGSPSLCRQGLACVSTILLNTIAGKMGGDVAIAGMSITTRFSMMANSALIGFGQGFQPVCSFNYGAALYDRVKKAYWFCIKYGTIFLVVVCLLCFGFTKQIIGFFRDDASVIRVGAMALRFNVVAFPLGAFTIMSNMMLQSIGKGVKGSIMASCKNGIFFIPFILLLPYFWGLLGVEMTQMWADICSFLLAIPLASSELAKWE